MGPLLLGVTCLGQPAAPEGGYGARAVSIPIPASGGPAERLVRVRGQSAQRPTRPSRTYGTSSDVGTARDTAMVPPERGVADVYI